MIINVCDQTKITIDTIKFEMIGMTPDEIMEFTKNIITECEEWRIKAIRIIAKR